MLRGKRLTMIDRYAHVDVVSIAREHVENGIRVIRITAHTNITPTSYTRLRMLLLTMVARGDGYIELWPAPTDDMLHGWTYYATA